MKRLENIAIYFSIVGPFLFILYHFLKVLNILPIVLGLPNLRFELLVFPLSIYSIYLGVKLKIFEEEEEDIDHEESEDVNERKINDHQEFSGKNRRPAKISEENLLFSDEHLDLIIFGLEEISKRYKSEFKIVPTLLFKKDFKIESELFPNFLNEEADILEIDKLLKYENPEIAVFYSKGVVENTNVIFFRIYNRNNFYVIKFMTSYWDLFIEAKADDIFKPIDMSEINPIYNNSNEKVKKLESISKLIENAKTDLMFNNEKYIDSLQKFQELTGIEKYFSDEASLYFQIDEFRVCLFALRELTKDEFEISNISSKDLEQTWVFNFDLNKIPCSINILIGDEESYLNDFFNQLNNLIKTHSASNKLLKVVMVASELWSDEYFDICLIDEETFNILVEHTPKYANLY